jgi:hypothetical protein
MRKHRTRNLEIPGSLCERPGMTEPGDTGSDFALLDAGCEAVPQKVVIPAHAGIQYAAAYRLITEVSAYWITRFRG